MAGVSDAVARRREGVRDIVRLRRLRRARPPPPLRSYDAFFLLVARLPLLGSDASARLLRRNPSTAALARTAESHIARVVECLVDECGEVVTRLRDEFSQPSLGAFVD